jgi:hypothetical protein
MYEATVWNAVASDFPNYSQLEPLWVELVLDYLFALVYIDHRVAKF